MFTFLLSTTIFVISHSLLLTLNDVVSIVYNMHWLKKEKEKVNLSCDKGEERSCLMKQVNRVKYKIKITNDSWIFLISFIPFLWLWWVKSIYGWLSNRFIEELSIWSLILIDHIWLNFIFIYFSSFWLYKNM